MQDGRVARGDFPAKAEIIAQKDIFSTYFYYLSIQNVGKPHYGHEIEMYTIEQGEKRDKRQ